MATRPSMTRLCKAWLLPGALLIAAEPAFAQALPGLALYQAKCGGCHSVDANRIGPLHRGVVGRRVASIAGYPYSVAIKRLGGVWTPARLDQWLQGPQRVAPGSNMYLSVPDAMQRKAIIAYLQSVSPAKTGR